MKYLKIFIIFITCLFIFGSKVYASEADTLAGLRSELAALKEKKRKADYKTAQTKSEINNAKNNIYYSQDEIRKNEKEIDEAKVEIEKLNIEIAKTEESIKGLMNALQESMGNNIYLEYLLDAKDYADLVYRYAIIEQVAADNTQKINTWEEKIDQNIQLQKDLTAREAVLKNEIAKLEQSVMSLGDQYDDYVEDAAAIKNEVVSTQEYINYLVNLGCGESQNIISCINMHGDTGFSKPLVKGTITSYFGYRIHPITGAKSSWHNAIDIGGNSEGTSVYASANGIVSKITRKSSCGGNQVYVHHNIAGKLYTTSYWHLLDIKVSIGQSVTRNTVVGTVGGGGRTPWDGCSTGAHLHFIIARGWYGTSCSGDCYLSWNTFKYVKATDPKEILKLPSKGIRWFSR